MAGLEGVEIGARRAPTPAAAPREANEGGNLLNQRKDETEAQTAAKFGEVWNGIQAKYGAKPEKPREIKKTLGKDDFLRIMITQMKNQDPTQPFKAEQFAAELAQFASVEQLQNMNQQMTKMATQNAPLERLAMTGMIGKTVTIDRERFPHTEGSNDSLNYVLPKDADQVKVAVVSDTGDVLIEKDLGNQKAGPNTFVWDGIRSNTLPAKAGNYMFRVTAVDGKGQSLAIQQQGQARVIGVSFEGGEPALLVGDPSKPDKVTMRNVVRVDSDASPHAAAAIPGTRSLADAVAQAQSALQSQLGGGPAQETPAAPVPASAQPAPQPQGAFKPAAAPEQAALAPSYFSFEKGKGSFNVDPSKLPPEAAAALARFEEERLEADRSKATAQREPAGPAEQKGFPNGLSDSN